MQGYVFDADSGVGCAMPRSGWGCTPYMHSWGLKSLNELSMDMRESRSRFKALEWR